MTRFLTLILCAAAAASFLGCDDAKTFVKESKEGYRELEEIAGKLGQIASAVKTNDFAQAKEFARKLEPFLNSRVLSWAVQILATEEKGGVEAARAAIERFRTSDGITAGEREALDKMQAFYRDKTGRTGDLLVLVAAIAVEEKFGGHGTGGLFIQICEKFRTHPMTGGVSVTNSSGTP
jgi:hypothetical protein